MSDGQQDQRFQRKTVLVKLSFQLKHFGLVFTAILLAFGLVGGELYFTLLRIVSGDNPALLPLLDQVNRMLLVKMILYLGIVAAVSFYVSHKIAGPLYRFEQSAQVVGTGDLTHRVHLRTGDELLELQDEFNGMVASLQGKALADRNLALRLAQRLERASAPLPEDSRRELASLKAELEHIGAGFKV
jgi:methyl-accepting chemotaxis protein